MFFEIISKLPISKLSMIKQNKNLAATPTRFIDAYYPGGGQVWPEAKQNFAMGSLGVLGGWGCPARHVVSDQ